MAVKIKSLKTLINAVFGNKTGAKKMSELTTNLEKNSVKYKENNLKKLNSTTGNTKQTPKNTGSPVKTKTTTPEPVKNPSTKTGLDNIPNTAKTTNVYKKGGTLATLGLGALLGGVATTISGVANTILPEGGEEGGGGGKGGKEIGPPEWWDQAEEDASGILDGLSDIPFVGDIVDAAEEGGWSLPLLAGIVIILIAGGVFAYKKISGKKPAGAAPKTRKRAAKRRSTA